MRVVNFTVELLAVGLLLMLLLSSHLGKHRICQLPWRALGSFRSHRRAMILSVASLTFLIGLVASAMRFPQPAVHDEFSYLLAADTFAHGRLANPTHPMWEHFETFHVLMQPTYASKYPPAQGMVLALGQLIWHPVVGVWLSSALAAGAVCWMLQGWVPGRWALLGSLILVFHPFIQLYWGQNYWGGQVAMFGAALVFGALPRIMRRPRVPTVVIMGLGAIVLANSRPYEGLFACLPAASIMLWWVLRKCSQGCRERRHALVYVVSTVVLMISVSAVWMGYYNFRITGHVLQLPYQLHQAQYPGTPLFLWHEPATKLDFRHRAIAEFYAGPALVEYRRQDSLVAIIKRKAIILLAFWLKFVHPTWTVSLVASMWALRRTSMRFAAATVFVGILGSLPVPWLQPHYVAPLIPLLVLVLVEGTRRLRLVNRKNRGVGRTLVTGLMLLWLGLFAIRLAAHNSEERDSFAELRAEFVDQFEELPGRHLVVIRYGRKHNTNQEWVYNAAEIDDAKTVWAREMTPSKNVKLLDYFHDRRVWLLEPDHTPPRLLEHQRDANNDARGHETPN